MHLASIALATYTMVAHLNHTTAAATFYVWTNSPSDGPGLCWTNAFHSIQAAVNAASSNDTVLVTNGVYRQGATRTPEYHDYLSGMSTDHDTYARVCVTNAVIVRSVNGPTETIVEGQEGFAGPSGTNAVRGLFIAPGGIVDGFTITNGHSRPDSWPNSYDCFGGGVYMEEDTQLNNCHVINNTAGNKAGGIYIASDATISNCTVSCNSAPYGAGVYLEGSGKLIDCTLSKNSSQGYGWGDGAGAYLSYGGTIQHCTIEGNTSVSWGGGVFLYGGGTVMTSSITNNTAERDGGGAYLYSSATLSNCTLRGNMAGSCGGGAYIRNTSAVYRCELLDNEAVYGGGAYVEAEGSIIASKLNGNTATNGGGAFIYQYGRVQHCELEGNNCTDRGGGAYITAGLLDASLSDSLLFANVAATDGGGVYCSGNARVQNCTVVGNDAASGGGAYLDSGYTPLVANCILWSNNASVVGKDIHRDSAGSDIQHTCASDGLTNGVDGCITSAPLFQNYATADYHLQSASPCIDTGSSPLMPSCFDLDGTPRPLDGDSSGSAIVDMGCYEYVNALADSDGDGMPDGWENDSGLNAASSNGPSANADSDPFTDLEEYIADTQPTNATSYFAVTDVTHDSPIAVHFSSSTNRLYTLKCCSNILATNWIPVPGRGPREGVGGPDLMIDTNSADKSFYRLHVELP